MKKKIHLQDYIKKGKKQKKSNKTQNELKIVKKLDHVSDFELSIL